MSLSLQAKRSRLYRLIYYSINKFIWLPLQSNIPLCAASLPFALILYQETVNSILMVNGNRWLLFQSRTALSETFLLESNNFVQLVGDTECKCSSLPDSSPRCAVFETGYAKTCCFLMHLWPHDKSRVQFLVLSFEFLRRRWLLLTYFLQNLCKQSLLNFPLLRWWSLFVSASHSRVYSVTTLGFQWQLMTQMLAKGGY